MSRPMEEILREAGPTVSVAVVAEAFGVSKAHIHNLINRGDLPLPVIKLGNRTRIPTAELRKSLGLAPKPDDTPIPGSPP